MRVIEYPHGVPSWVDLSSPDLDASAAFYGGLFGWECAESEGPVEETGGYRMFLLGGEVVAGLGPVREGVPPHWMTYVAVENAALVQADVECAGGSTVLEPLQIVDAGTMAMFADSAGGARFAIWQPGRHAGAQVVNAVGALSMNELQTRDFDAAARFYGTVFGWEVERIEQDGRLMYGSVKLDGRLIAGLLPIGEGFPAEMPANWLPYFGVADLEDSMAAVGKLGGRAMTEPMQVPSGRFAAVKDAHGARFALFEGTFDPPPGPSGI